MGSIGYIAIALALYWLALLSRKLGRVTHAKPYYIGLFIASALVNMGALPRLIHELFSYNVQGSVWWVLVYNGFPALGLTVGVIFAWRYWSWLFAERD